MALNYGPTNSKQRNVTTQHAVHMRKRGGECVYREYIYIFMGDQSSIQCIDASIYPQFFVVHTISKCVYVSSSDSPPWHHIRMQYPFVCWPKNNSLVPCYCYFNIVINVDGFTCHQMMMFELWLGEMVLIKQLAYLATISLSHFQTSFALFLMT